LLEGPEQKPFEYSGQVRHQRVLSLLPEQRQRAQAIRYPRLSGPQNWTEDQAKKDKKKHVWHACPSKKIVARGTDYYDYGSHQEDQRGARQTILHLKMHCAELDPDTTVLRVPCQLAWRISLVMMLKDFPVKTAGKPRGPPVLGVASRFN
jgi:hypothetical protein